MRIGELSVPASFDGLIVWGRIYDRPFLRCLHGYGLCLWRLGRAVEASPGLPPHPLDEPE